MRDIGELIGFMFAVLILVLLWWSFVFLTTVPVVWTLWWMGVI